MLKNYLCSSNLNLKCVSLSQIQNWYECREFAQNIIDNNNRYSIVILYFVITSNQYLIKFQIREKLR